jgi:5-methylthioadenosine/S-adenosylhomocysteine deaminase
MHAAIYRSYPWVQESPNDSIKVFRPEESLSFEEALSIYTINGAYCAGEEERLGTLRVGYRADFVVVKDDQLDASKPSTDPMTDPHFKRMKNVQVQQVWVNGQCRYENKQLNKLE